MLIKRLENYLKDTYKTQFTDNEKIALKVLFFMMEKIRKPDNEKNCQMEKNTDMNYRKNKSCRRMRR